MTFSRRSWAICGVLYLLAQVFFLINIQFPRGQNFDEFHYVPSAKQFLELKENQNYEHPPLGKELMAVGIGLFGDRPIGWRFMSTVFGALTLVGMYLWALAVFRDEKTALWTAGITLVNQLLYVQARIGMLDTFMFAFLAFAFAAFCASFRPGIAARDARRLLHATGLMVGLATACKWFGIIPWAYFAGIAIVARVLQHWGTCFEKQDPERDWYFKGAWEGVRARDFVLALGIVPLLAYFATFIPFFFIETPKYGLLDLFRMQAKMWDGQSRVVTAHPYMSTWPQWATLKRPIWYAFDKEGGAREFVRGIVLLGNPLLMWGGLLGVLACAWGWVADRRRDAFLIVTSYAALYFSWALIPRKVAFYYYYYPAGMCLSLALAYLFQQVEREIPSRAALWVRWGFLAFATAVFIYFFPILAALRIPADEFRKWMWFPSWI